MVPHLMTCSTWKAIKKALINEFMSEQILSKQKQALMSIQIFLGKLAPSFAGRFYQEAQVLFTCQRLEINDDVTVIVS